MESSRAPGAESGKGTRGLTPSADRPGLDLGEGHCASYAVGALDGIGRLADSARWVLRNVPRENGSSVDRADQGHRLAAVARRVGDFAFRRGV
jgi:hypothetical protein